ncbi:MAG TPA: hypothetical protein VN788_00135 [Verrucomicrobiae bacterium]|nr:hypothetical protein [Verrucomicrobiae bacterium]
MSPATAAPNVAPNGAAPGMYNDLLYFYPLNPPQLLANAVNIAAVVTIDNDSDFLWDRIIANSTGLFSVTLTDRFTSRPLMPSNINGENLAGTAQLPFWLPVPYKLRRTSTIQASFNDRSGAPNTIQFVLVGRKIS